jgi:methylated-DNA-[protein]-cysteine S-methyltransferase
MQWNVTADRIKSVEFFKMFIDVGMGKPLLYQGAIAFGESHDSGTEVLKVFIPAPHPDILYEEIARFHQTKFRERLFFHRFNKEDIIEMVQSYCQRGLPLIDIFDESIAKIEGLTIFQMACYQHACRIPHGETRSYAWLAERIKKFGAERAVGGAMRTNPFPLFIPCHRIVKKDGKIGGFMGEKAPDSWQISIKRSLLEVEGLHQQPSLFSFNYDVAIQ